LTGEEGVELGEIMDGGLILRGGALTLPEEHPDRALSRHDGALSRHDGALSRRDGALLRLAKCVAAFVNLMPRRKKSVGILVKNTATFVRGEGVLTKARVFPRFSAIIL
jgi:hypothetical protein